MAVNCKYTLLTLSSLLTLSLLAYPLNLMINSPFTTQNEQNKRLIL